MRKLALAIAATLSLSLGACDTMSTQTSPAPLAATTTDEKALLYAYESYDFVLTTVDVLRDSGKLVPGTPKAKAVQGYLMTIRDALTAASAARRAGSTSSYEEAFAQAQVALSQIKGLLK